MVKETVSIQEVIQFLNDLLRLDPECVMDICSTEIPCNVNLEQHLTIPIVNNSVTLMGLLNGIFGRDENGWGYIVMEVDMKTGKISRFADLRDIIL